MDFYAKLGFISLQSDALSVSIDAIVSIKVTRPWLWIFLFVGFSHSLYMYIMQFLYDTRMVVATRGHTLWD